MRLSADLIINIAEPAGVTAEFFRKKDEQVLYGVLTYAVYYFNRDPGWFEVELNGVRYFACKTRTLPFLYTLNNRNSTLLTKAFFERSMKHINLASGSKDPDIWIAFSANYFCPLPCPGVNLWHARKMLESYDRSFEIQAEHDGEQELEDTFKLPAEARSNKLKAKNDKTKNGFSSVKEEAVMQRFYQGWSVKDIALDQCCSESYIYKLIKKKKGITALDLRWHKWKMIADMYQAIPRRSLSEIEGIYRVSRSQIYHAVKKVAEKEKGQIPEKRSNKKLTEKDLKNIHIKINQGALRKDICEEYGITSGTLIKYLGHSVKKKPKLISLKEQAVKLRIQGKTIKQTSEALGLSTDLVKSVWRKMKDDNDVIRRKEKYDNRNPLSKRDRDQAVNAVLIDGHTRKQVCKQYGINALTLRRYIRKAQQNEVEQIKNKPKNLTNKDTQ